MQSICSEHKSNTLGQAKGPSEPVSSHWQLPKPDA